MTLVSLNEATNGRVPGQFHPIGIVTITIITILTTPSITITIVATKGQIVAGKGEATQMTPNFKQPVPLVPAAPPTLVHHCYCFRARLLWCQYQYNKYHQYHQCHQHH